MSQQMLKEFQTHNRDAAVSWETAFDMKNMKDVATTPEQLHK